MNQADFRQVKRNIDVVNGKRKPIKKKKPGETLSVATCDFCERGIFTAIVTNLKLKGLYHAECIKEALKQKENIEKGVKENGK